MTKCTFCGKDYPIHKGLTLVDSVTGKITYLCSGKCRKNNKIRKAKKVRWTEINHKIKQDKLSKKSDSKEK